MINVNDFKRLTDNETIENAIKNRQADGIVVISPRCSDIEPERTYWLLDRAILIPENTTIILQNCMIKLSDRCRDNFFRTENCGMGIEFAEKIRNVHIKGEGLCILQGADHPRASGDGGKILKSLCPYEPKDVVALADWVPEERRSVDKLDFWDLHDCSYGTDADDPNESHKGDWRGIGILFANVENFSISNVKIVESHGWGISLEACTYGRVEKIEFDACMSKGIDGLRSNMENQDGVDIRNGCHHIVITDITGRTGDDVVALTAIVGTNSTYKPGGSLCTTHVMHNDWTKRDRNIHDIIIRNVIAYSNLCWTVRLLAANTEIWNIVIDGIIDSAPDDVIHSGGILIGDGDSDYGTNHKDSIRNVTISNVICNSKKAIDVKGYLSDSVISNVVNHNKSNPIITVEREDGLNNVKII